MKWNEAPFEDIVSESAFGPRFSSECYDPNGNIATLRTTDISNDGVISTCTMPLARIDADKFRSHFLKPGDLVISRSGRIGTTALFTGHHIPVLPGAFLIRFRLRKEKANPLFYKHYFNSKDGQQKLLSVAQGAAQQNINITNVKKITIPIPPIKEQDAIAKIISSYENLINTNQRRIALLEEAARLIYREWFVNLRFPGHDSIEQKNGTPTGWAKKPLGEIAKLHYGKALKASERKPGKFPVYGSSGIVGYHNTPFVQAGAIIVGRKGNIGSLFYSDNPCFPIDTVFFIPPEESSRWLFLALHSLNFISSDSAVPGLNRTYAESLPIMEPDPLTQERFKVLTDPLFTEIEILQQQNHRLAQARDILLPKLMSGQIDVSNIQLPDEDVVT